MTPEIPEQLPGESMEEYRARVAEFERQYASNLSGRTGPSLPASANNPFYSVYAARGGRIGYLLGGSGGSDVIIAHNELNKETVNMIVNTLNLEAGDVIKMQADTSNTITGVVSYALIDRSQENG
jgi:hypothetical protein